MGLKRLELSGFKSFAKNTLLEFSSPITAVVGPNGSGKSNVADAMRWVLGEQSIKSLRGKRGEDLIFSGSPASPRLSKASVVLFFDNTAREFPLEFDEVQIGRRVYRDGANDYLINGSEVRLKDVLELLAKVGFGSSQHHIIGQGEADRILYASPQERREMVEDALGVKIFQIKRLEAERKLERTRENIKQVEGLKKEIGPHLKFLKSQVEKFEVASKLREELKKLLEDYLSKKEATIAQNKIELLERRAQPDKELKKVEAELLSLERKLEEGPEKGDLNEEKRLEGRFKELREERLKAEHELGRLEGMIELEQKNFKETNEQVVSKKEIEEILNKVARELDAIGRESVLNQVFQKIKELRIMLQEFLSSLKGEWPSKDEDIKKYRERLEVLKGKLSGLKKEEGGISKLLEEKALAQKKETEEILKEERRFYELEKEASRLKDVIRGISLEGEKIRFWEDEFKRELEEARVYIDQEQLRRLQSESRPFASGEEAQSLRKKVERTKIKLEEAGGIDAAVLKEYQEISSRDEFLGKELSDLNNSVQKLGEIMKELNEKLEHDFKEGVLKINLEFEKFFKTMFGGGRAGLKIVQKSKVKNQNAEDDEMEEIEEGIDISVDLPRKRIKSLDMLSGGERALTSIALLFAMSNVHPPPFLVLDETDAALDEANSERYAKMLEDLSNTTQLVLITHNRTTMKCAGVLYGVTMGSDGISKLLSIKFEEAGALVP